MFVIRSLDFQFIYLLHFIVAQYLVAFCMFHKYIVRGHREHKQSDLESKEEMKMYRWKIVCPNPFYIQISISNILYFTAYFTHFLLHSNGCFQSSAMTFLRCFLCFIILYFHFLHLFEDFFNVYIFSYLPYNADNNDNDEVNCGNNNNNRDDVDNLFHLDFLNPNVGPFFNSISLWWFNEYFTYSILVIWKRWNYIDWKRELQVVANIWNNLYRNCYEIDSVTCKFRNLFVHIIINMILDSNYLKFKKNFNDFMNFILHLLLILMLQIKSDTSPSLLATFLTDREELPLGNKLIIISQIHSLNIKCSLTNPLQESEFQFALKKIQMIYFYKKQIYSSSFTILNIILNLTFSHIQNVEQIVINFSFHYPPFIAPKTYSIINYIFYSVLSFKH